MMVWLNAWPMCSVPVTFGGGNCIENAAASARGAPLPRNPATPSPRRSHSAPHRACRAAGSKDFDRLSRPGCCRGELMGVKAERVDQADGSADRAVQEAPAERA